MNTVHKITITALAGTAVVVTGIGIGTSAASASEGLSDKQLVALYEEERLAGDVYVVLGAGYDVQIFDKIGAAEDRHQASVATLLQARGYDIGSLPTAPGDYATDGYDELYTDFVAAGSTSLDDAFGVGVTIEQTDISDLKDLLTQTDDPAETQVLTALLNGSTHHLDAFTGDAAPGNGMQSGKDNGSRGMGPANRPDGPGMQRGGLPGSGDCLLDGDGGRHRYGS
jgi:hypothetical protein